MTRRTQQQLCYAAERGLPRGRDFASIEETQRILDDLREQPWWPEGVYRVEAYRVDRDNSSARWEEDSGAGIISFGRGNELCELVLCHELAHVIADKKGSTAHDPLWARTYLEVIYNVRGSVAYLELKAGFDREGVDYDR